MTGVQTCALPISLVGERESHGLDRSLEQAQEPVGLVDLLPAVLADQATQQAVMRTDQLGGAHIAQAIDHRQAKARNMVIEIEDAVAGKMKFIGNPMKISGFPDPATRAPAPDLDGNRAQILAELK